MTVGRADFMDAFTRVNQKLIGDSYISILVKALEQLVTDDNEQVLAIYGQNNTFAMLTSSRVITAKFSKLGKPTFSAVPILRVQLSLFENHNGSRTRISVNDINDPTSPLAVVEGNKDGAAYFMQSLRYLKDSTVMMEAYGDDEQPDCGIEYALLIGATGAPGLLLGSRYSVAFFPTRLVIRDTLGPVSVWQQSDVIDIVVDGPGLVTTGGGAIGGGFGSVGAAEGMLAADILNALTTRQSIETYCKLRLKSASLIFLYEDAAPRELWTQLLPVTHRIAAASEEAAGKRFQPAPEAHLVQNLRDLAFLHEQGHLNDVEYATAKTKLLSLARLVR